MSLNSLRRQQNQMDIRIIVFLVIIVFKVIQWIAKKATEDAERQRRLAKRGNSDRKRRVQSEIDAFLSEVGGGNQPAERNNSDDRRRQEQQKQQAIARRRQQEERRRRREAAAAQKQSQRAQDRRVGSGISEHVDQYISKHVEEHIDHDIEEYVEATIVDNVEEHLGDRDEEMPAQTTTRKKSSEAAEAVAAMLRNPEGVRNAILVNEVLARPRSLR